MCQRSLGAMVARMPFPKRYRAHHVQRTLTGDIKIVLAPLDALGTSRGGSIRRGSDKPGAETGQAM